MKRQIFLMALLSILALSGQGQAAFGEGTVQLIRWLEGQETQIG